MQAHEILEGAARRIQTDGLHKKGFFGEDGYCMMGAMRMTWNGDLRSPFSAEYDAALEELGKVCIAETPAFLLAPWGQRLDSPFVAVTICNDAEDTTQSQVVALLEKAATNLRP